MKFNIHSILIFFGSISFSVPTYADQESLTTHSSAPYRASGRMLAGEKLGLDLDQPGYWDAALSDGMKAVQNRLYSKSHRLELGAIGGFTMGDPFLSTADLGARMGFYLSDLFEIHAIALRHFTKTSTALDTLESIGTTSNTNPSHWFVGGGIEFSPIYGKVSFLSGLIFHYDLYINSGIGQTYTETGNYLTGYFGIGQMFFISRHLGLRLDYKMFLYNEILRQKIDPATLGQVVGNNFNRSDSVFIGLSLFL